MTSGVAHSSMACVGENVDNTISGRLKPVVQRIVVDDLEVVFLTLGDDIAQFNFLLRGEDVARHATDGRSNGAFVLSSGRNTEER